MSGQVSGSTVSGGIPPLVAVSTTSTSQGSIPRKTLQDTIKEIEAQITLLEQTPNATSRQQEDLAKLKELHMRALTEQEKLKSSKQHQQIQQLQQQQQMQQQQQQIQQQQVTPTMTPVRTGTPPSATTNPAPNSSSSQTYSTAPANNPSVAPPATSKPSTMTTGSHISIDPSQILDKKKIQDLVKEVDPNTQLDDDVEEMLLQIADDFIENIVTAGCQLAKHRKSNTLETKDILLHLERNWNILVPGYSTEENRQYKRPASTEAHKQRMALIRKTLKK